MAPPSTSLRRDRERDLVAATRALFDERGVQEAPIEEVARSAGIARGLVYRHFSSKDELFVLTVTDYLGELGDLMDRSAAASEREPHTHLQRSLEVYAEFCARYPAFLDCALSLMRRRSDHLQSEVSEVVWLKLGQGIARCVSHFTRALRAGTDAGVLEVEDPDYLANLLWTQMLGVMHLTRIGVGVRHDASGQPELFRVERERVIRTSVDAGLAAAGAHRAP